LLFNDAQITLIEEGQPGEHFVLSGTYYSGPWSDNLRFNYFGEVSGEGFTPGFAQTWGSKVLTDISASRRLTDDLSITFAIDAGPEILVVFLKCFFGANGV